MSKTGVVVLAPEAQGGEGGGVRADWGGGHCSGREAAPARLVGPITRLRTMHQSWHVRYRDRSLPTSQQACGTNTLYRYKIGGVTHGKPSVHTTEIKL